MHPALSVIFFTTASGAGYGLLFLLSLLSVFGLLPPDRLFGLVALGLGAALVVFGLLSSTFHLGRPERAWRAFSQWRSSWLSREGVAAATAFFPLALFAFGWVWLGRTDGLFALAGVATAIMCAITVACTAMIYASLKTIRQWRSPLTLPVYLALALATGALLLCLVASGFGLWRPAVGWLALALLVVAYPMKRAWRKSADRAPALSTLASAIGMPKAREVRMLEAPHTEENFIMREMGFQIARKHALKLRTISAVSLFLFPALALLLALAPLGLPVLPLMILATISAAFGVIVERWLFFAEATHVAMLYYGRAT